MGARGPAAWQPPENLLDEEDNIVLPFDEWFEAQLLKGRSLRTISAMLKTSPPVMVRLLHKNKHLDDIRNAVIKKWPMMLKERSVELALEGNTTLLIYLSKTIGGLGDGAQAVEPEPGLLEPVPAMTKAQALQLVEKFREVKNVSEIA